MDDNDDSTYMKEVKELNTNSTDQPKGKIILDAPISLKGSSALVDPFAKDQPTLNASSS